MGAHPPLRLESRLRRSRRSSSTSQITSRTLPLGCLTRFASRTKPSTSSPPSPPSTSATITTRRAAACAGPSTLIAVGLSGGGDGDPPPLLRRGGRCTLTRLQSGQADAPGRRVAVVGPGRGEAVAVPVSPLRRAPALPTHHPALLPGHVPGLEGLRAREHKGGFRGPRARSHESKPVTGPWHAT